MERERGRRGGWEREGRHWFKAGEERGNRGGRGSEHKEEGVWGRDEWLRREERGDGKRRRVFNVAMLRVTSAGDATEPARGNAWRGHVTDVYTHLHTNCLLGLVNRHML